MGFAQTPEQFTKCLQTAFCNSKQRQNIQIYPFIDEQVAFYSQIRAFREAALKPFVQSPRHIMLEGFNPDQIQDLDGTREAIIRLLNLVETLKAENDRLRTENQSLRDEINRLKGEQGKPDIKPNRKKKSRSTSTNYSSEKERHQPKKRHKRSKKDKIEIDRERVLKVDPETLPEDAEFKGYEDVTVQDIKIETDNVLFRKEKY